MKCLYSGTVAVILLFDVVFSQSATGAPPIAIDTAPTQVPEPAVAPAPQNAEFDLLLKKAAQGDAEAQFKVGYSLYSEKGVAKNLKEAFSWLSKSSEAGNAKATCMIGSIYYYDVAEDKGNEKAKQLFQASLNGVTLLAESGDSEAQRFLGHLYFLDVGIPKDFNKSFGWYKKAAEQGDAVAQYCLGQSYDYGQGVTRDGKQAFVWYTKAAEQGDSNAQFYLGLMYYIGEDVPKDYKKAFEWFTVAAEQGETDAQYFLGGMYANGRGVPKDEMKAIEWHTKAAYLGSANAQYELGAIFDIGQGVPQDYEKAYAWYNLADVQGVEDAGKSRDKLLPKMSPEQIANARKLSQELSAKIEALKSKDVANLKLD